MEKKQNKQTKKKFHRKRKTNKEKSFTEREKVSLQRYDCIKLLTVRGKNEEKKVQWKEKKNKEESSKEREKTKSRRKFLKRKETRKQRKKV